MVLWVSSCIWRTRRYKL